MASNWRLLLFAVAACIFFIGLLNSWASTSTTTSRSRPDEESTVVPQSFKPWGISRTTNASRKGSDDGRKCDFAQGHWVLGEQEGPKRYPSTCPEIRPSWNCIQNSHPNAEGIPRWEWQPDNCPLPKLDPLAFARQHSGKRLAIIGDRVAHETYAAMACALREADPGARHLGLLGAMKGVRLPKYNLTLGYHRTRLLVRHVRWQASPEGTRRDPLEARGYQQGWRVDADVADKTWARALYSNFYDAFIISTGHEWASPLYNSRESPLLFFSEDAPILPPLSVEEGLRLVLRTVTDLISRRPRRVPCFFLSPPPTHFMHNRDCSRRGLLSPEEVEVWLDPTRRGANWEGRAVAEAVHVGLELTGIRMLDITTPSEPRADGHPARWTASVVAKPGGVREGSASRPGVRVGHGGSVGRTQSVMDCRDWCLPGVPDVWVDIVAAVLTEELKEN